MTRPHLSLVSEPAPGAFEGGFDAGFAGGFDEDLFDGGTATREEWQDQALCAQTDPEAFFPEKGGSTREAKKICQRCPVRGECLEYALAHDERFGIWGGLSERERRRLKRGIV
ncbi:WhiB family transcriptional regulator [Mycobacterium sp. 1274756.6]|uniref:WhiB family transcriptional regulator n=1 Tax=Mycobacterium sp. 1274756.6 TaxID=1834076 RepID=UPI000AF1F968|nr:WhiB family transcriptional regulator [Mycobacterium sp. 1274756.6]